jgi:hypothetical protein
MRNKKLLYLLLPITAIVWGLVIYKIMQSLDTTGEENYDIAEIKPIETINVVPDTFNLLLNYRDPFLAYRPTVRRNVSATFTMNKADLSISNFIKPPEKAASVSTTATNPWPVIEYHGLIENSQNKSKVAMIHIDNAVHLMLEGHTTSGIKLTKILPDSIQVEFNKQKKFIWKYRM